MTHNQWQKHIRYHGQKPLKKISTPLSSIYINNPSAAKDSLNKIKIKASELCSFPEKGRLVPELKTHGILQYRELIIPPWRVIYRISEEQIYVPSVIDSRRNIEDILLQGLVRKNNANRVTGENNRGQVGVKRESAA